ncbi:MAG: hypothetical protein JWL76_2082 [Thermoleophilia bacterium]|nr:hypothetical protein [Thermoleophilia bacterium]
MSEADGADGRRPYGKGRRLVWFAIAVAVIATLAVKVAHDRPWVSDEVRIERCAKLRHDRDLVLKSKGDPKGDFSLEDARTFCRLDAANDNLNHKGGVYRF